MQDSSVARDSTVAVVGAAGHTGRFVIRELLRRGLTPIAIARSAADHPALAEFDTRVLRRSASLDTPHSLDSALAGASAVINCAGPFLDTSDAVARAALQARIHYLDISAEQASTAALLANYDDAARNAGVVLLPGMGFYGGFADLLATSLVGEWPQVDAIDIMIGLDSWYPTRGTRLTGKRNTAERRVIANGALAPMNLPPREMHWTFASPLGPQSLIEVPLSEIVLIARHVRTQELHTYLSSVALADIRNAATPPPQPADSSGRSAQRFIVDVEVRRAAVKRRISASGRDIYAFTAPLICEAAERLLGGHFNRTGAQSPGATFDPPHFLATLAPEYLQLVTSPQEGSD